MGKTLSPDYAFRIGKDPVFFVEAKQPSKNLAIDPQPAYQVRSYGWNAKLPVSVVTDFEEFCIYDCRLEPKKMDEVHVGLIDRITYDEYINEWDLISLFAKRNVLQGSLLVFDEGKVPRKTTPVDEAFLDDLTKWRKLLAQNMAIRNRNLTLSQLTSAVQGTLDRIVFLRICEDRGIEDEEQLKEIADGGDIYRNLCEIFKHADRRYNSGLFHFRPEPGRGIPEPYVLSLIIDDKVLEEIILGLYNRPYNFRVLPPEILGQAYERFLGDVIRLTDGHQARVEPNPDIRKGEGIYYTPSFIVDYIVKNTVGRLLKGKMPSQASKLRILDPACGSGSFLLGAYTYLLNWHLDWYATYVVPLLKTKEDQSSHKIQKLLPPGYEPHSLRKSHRGKRKGEKETTKFPIFEITKGDWRLTVDEKKRILLDCIYGVDLDPQAWRLLSFLFS
jgi:hypothetical protein